jgi:hypothetical protein
MTDAISNPMLTIRSLKGSSLSVLVALVVARVVCKRDSLSARELQDWTGYSDENVTSGARLLTQMALIVKARIGWALAEGVQYVLPGLFRESDFIGLPATTTTLLISNSKEQREKVVVAVPKTPIISESSNFHANYKVCVRYGIGEPARTRISQQFDELDQPITPDFIQAHVESRQRGETMGLIIMRIENNEFPKVWEEEIDCIKRKEKDDDDPNSSNSL